MPMETGLLDSWEQNGFNADGNGTIDVNLPAFGANPRRKDIFVEVIVWSANEPFSLSKARCHS